MGKEVGSNLAVIGGDGRELILIWELTKKGFVIKTFGFPEELLPREIKICAAISEAVKNVGVIILPMPGIRGNGILHIKFVEKEFYVTAEDFAGISPGTVVFVGIASKFLKEMARELHFSLVEVADLDEVAIPNSIPTAEGAIQLAMEKLPITIHSCQVLVIGFGRVAETLAWMLKGIGAHVIVAARNPIQLAKCRILGYETVELHKLAQNVKNADLVFNTVPAMIMNREVLMQLKKETVIIDLASHPGGTDFSAAQELGILALLAPGLPGKVAPVTAGKILAEAYPTLIEKMT